MGGCFAGGIFFFGGSLVGGGPADLPADLGAGADPAFAFTVALSNASSTLAFLTSDKLSTTALSARFPTIFMSVPRHTAASFRAPSNESSRREESASESGLICGPGIGAGDVERHLAMNFNVPSLTCGFFEFRAGRVSGNISVRVVYITKLSASTTLWMGLATH